MNPGYPHPEDEFDQASSSEGPRGVHRAPRSRLQRWWPFLVVVLVFPALAFGLVTWLSDWDGLSGVDNPLVEETAEPSGTAAAEETAPPAETTAPTETPAEPEEPAETPEPTTPEADLARDVRVLNTTGTSGLAAGAVGSLEEAGFTSLSAGNWSGDAPAVSTVYYPGPDDAGTAQAVADALGITTVTESAAIADDRVVVALADDFEG